MSRLKRAARDGRGRPSLHRRSTRADRPCPSRSEIFVVGTPVILALHPLTTPAPSSVASASCNNSGAWHSSHLIATSGFGVTTAPGSDRKGHAWIDAIFLGSTHRPVLAFGAKRPDFALISKSTDRKST